MTAAITSNDPVSLARRAVLRRMMQAAVLPAAMSPAAAFSQSDAFSFDALSDEMRARAEEEPRNETIDDPVLGALEYEDYTKIAFRPDRARWADTGQFRLHAFHPGWLFDQPVRMFDVSDGTRREMTFDRADFEYRGDLADRIPEDMTLPGVAGFRLHTPLNRADIFDELAVFLGASYFRALGRGDVYGLSARGLAIDTGTERPEEFPRFSAFYLERPAPGAQRVTLYAALESASVTGAYRFEITPGAKTRMDVTARLFFRAEVGEVGIAPLTSMYLRGGNDPGPFDDFRPKVHDSEGLYVVSGGGEPTWRPLNNPSRLASSYFGAESPTAFGLHQRDRDFGHYLDAGAQYHRRPSILVEPLGDWGPGAVRLVELPSDLEINDNIVAFWVPEAAPAPGDAWEFSYRLSWGEVERQIPRDLARVLRCRTGSGGVAGVPDAPDTRKFVVDFEGGLLDRLPADARDDLTVETGVSAGKIVETVLSKIPGSTAWRLVIELDDSDTELVELRARIAGYDRVLSETWLYQWMPEDE